MESVVVFVTLLTEFNGGEHAWYEVDVEEEKRRDNEAQDAC